MSENPKLAADAADPAPPQVPLAAEPSAEAAAAPAAPVAAAKPRKPRAASVVQQTVARHQKALAEALEMAQAIKYDAPAVDDLQAAKKPSGKPDKPGKAEKSGKAEKAEKAAKPRKPKLVRDSYAMPEAEYAVIGELKKRLAAVGHEVKKSELLRAGIARLAALNDGELLAVMQGVERIKTGRPSR